MDPELEARFDRIAAKITKDSKVLVLVNLENQHWVLVEVTMSATTMQLYDPMQGPKVSA